MKDAVTFHSEQAARWEEGYSSDIFSNRLKTLDSLLPKDMSGRLWLDAGCGTGTIARWLAGRGATVTGIDASAPMIANAAPHERVSFAVRDVVNTRLESGSFDGVVCSSVIEYLEDPGSALDEFQRVLKPSSWLAISAPSNAPTVRLPLKAAYWITRPLGKHRLVTFLDHSRHSYSAESFSSLLKEHGFSISRIIKFGRVDAFGITISPTPSLLMVLARSHES